MKKYRVLLVLAVLAILLGGIFIYEQTRSVSKQNHSKSPATTDQLIVGILQPVSHPALDEIKKGIVAGLAKHGYQADKQIKIVFQNAQGDQSKMNTMVSSILEQKPAILIGIGTQACQAFANATKEIPIIMGAVADPVKTGLVASNERPGGNVTGVKNEAPVQQQMLFIKELMPTAQRIGLLYSNGEDNSKAEAERAAKEARAVGLEATAYTVTNTNDIKQMVANMCQKEDLIYLPTDNLIASAMETVVDEANRQNKAVIPTVDQMVAQGGLATVGISQYQMGVEAGRMAADVLAGKSKPADTPTFVLTKGKKLVNQKQAEKLNFDIPQKILAEAEIVEPINEK